MTSYTGTDTETDTDVLIVGYGPVGQLLAILLAQRGWQVTVVERWPEPYTMPRAVAFDGECARILASAGIGEYITEVGEPSGDYLWRNAAGEELLYIGAAERNGASGWPDSTSMYQPGLEARLIERGAELPGLRVLRGYEGLRLEQREDGVELLARSADGGQRTISARWAVGCDGANSFVRRQIGEEVTDADFSYDWLICDVVLNEPREFVPNNLQICDPRRPRTEVSAGPGHRRWEFMLLPGETRQQMDTVESAWRMLATFGVTPEDATLERHAVYTFQASCAVEWRADRLLIAGDAAHLMPPFAGQGMSSGFRDAANLAWKLDLALRGLADERLLDSYTAERRAHVQHAIGMSVNLGKVICQTDPAAAADRDAVMIGLRERNLTRPQSPFRPLLKGVLAAGAPAAGRLVPQPRVARGAEQGLFDEVVGTGFTLLSTEDPADFLGPEQLDYLAGIGARAVRVLPAGTAPERAVGDAVVDLDGGFGAFLAATGAVSVLVRPDFYAFGTAADPAGSAALVDALRAQLSAAAFAH